MAVLSVRLRVWLPARSSAIFLSFLSLSYHPHQKQTPSLFPLSACSTYASTAVGYRVAVLNIGHDATNRLTERDSLSSL